MKINFVNPNKAYEFMNSWTRIKTSYEIQFAGKEVKNVEVLMKNEKPTFAYVHYKKGIHTGVETINLLSKILINKRELFN